MSDSGGDGIELVEIADPQAQPDLVQQVFDDVLRPSFDEDELPSVDVLMQGKSDGYEQTLIVASDADGPAAAAVYGRQSHHPVGLLSYLAARPGERGRGLGGRVLARLTAIAVASDVGVVLGEVHDPRFHAESEDERPRARLRFYERHGARVLDAPFVQPRLSDGTERVRDMLLLVLHARPEVLSEGVPAEWIDQWCRTYFVDEEGNEPDDDEYRALVGRWRGRDRVPVVPVSAFESVQPLPRR